MNKNKLLWGGSIIVGTTLIMIIYFIFSILGITQSPIKRYDLEITTESVEKIYDGTPLTSNTWSIQSGLLITGHSIKVTMNESITNPGSIANEIGVTILDEDSNNVTSNYNIIYNLGTLTVNKRDITIKTESLDKMYDGTPLTSNTWSIQSGLLITGHSIKVTMNESITNPGSITNEIGVTILDEDSNNVTSNYNIIYNLGTLTVHKRDITIKTESLDKVYDGTPLTSNNWLIQSGTLITNHIVEATMNASITNQGSILNEISVSILDEKSNDLTNYYNIVYNLGTLTVNKRDIKIETESLEKTYDGIPLTSDKWLIQSGTLLADHSIEVTMNSSIINPGLISNEIDVAILDVNRSDVTGNYNIIYNLGQLRINQINLLLQSGSANKEYDGTPLTCDDWDLVHGTLLDNHELIVNVVGEITDVGTIDNLIHAYIVDQKGNNVTNYYNINLLLGRLTILTSIYSSGELSRESQEPSYETLLQIYTDKTDYVYLRDMSWGDYNKYGWNLGKPHNIDIMINPISFSSIALLESGRQSNSIQIKHLREYIPYLTPYYATDDFSDLNDIHIYGVVNSLYTFNYISYDYENSSKTLLNNPLYTEQESLYRNYVYDNYMKLPDSTRISMLDIAQENNLDPSKSTIVTDVQRYIQNAARYNLNFTDIPDDVEDIAVYFLTVSKEGICQHYATAATLMYRTLGIPARYVTGFVGKATANQWSDVTAAQAHAWVEIYIDGMGWIQVEVTGSMEEKPEITVTPKPVKLLYTEGAEPIKASSVNVTGFKEYKNKGYTYHVSFGGEQSSIGIGTSTITDFIIYDANGTDVTDKFDITYKTGILQYYAYQITFETESDSKEYDGSILTNSSWNIIGELSAGHYLDIDDIVFTGQQLNVGMSQNRAKIVIIDENGNDVTSMYLINYNFGNLVVNPRDITIQSKSAFKTYDGLPLICYEYNIDGSLVNGDIINVIISGTQTNIGSSDNIIDSVHIENVNGDVTFNYRIEYIEGKLTVTPAL